MEVNAVPFHIRIDLAADVTPVREPRATSISPSMPANQTAERPRMLPDTSQDDGDDNLNAVKASTQSIDTKSSESGGLQLLSPTLQRSIQATAASTAPSSRSTEFFGWSTTPLANQHPLGFGTSSSVGKGKVTTTKSDTRGSTVHSVDSSSVNRESTKGSKPFDFDGFTTASVQARHTQQEEASVEASRRQSSRLTSISSHEQQPQVIPEYCAFYYDQSPLQSSEAPNPMSCSMGSARTTRSTEDLEMLELQRRQRQHSVGLTSKRSSVNIYSTGAKHTPITSATAAAAGWPLAKSKQSTAVTMRGWLQKRKGLVLKRWKPYYCLFKGDDSLCLYSSEDTVNGRLEQRYQVLRVVFTDRNDSFHIIGVDSDGAPRREEFRASVSPEWARWFRVLRGFFDHASLQEAMLRKPELTLTPTHSDSGLGHVLRHGGWRLSSYSNNNEEGEYEKDGEIPGGPDGALTDGYTNRKDGFTSHTPSAVAAMPTHLAYQPYDERRSYLRQRKPSSSSALRESLDGFGEDQRSTVSSFSGSSGTNHGPNNQTEDTAAAQPSIPARASKASSVGCPMIERESQVPVPLLEIRSSESMRDSDIQPSIFSWSK
ncbi:hypothetical protein BBJ28_00010955 [Nothophytophthora sp. Chile5]|nr:hypothetical protein BBJ28_00010955 [Nothophytophthora sp. Chile5]